MSELPLYMYPSDPSAGLQCMGVGAGSCIRDTPVVQLDSATSSLVGLQHVGSRARAPFPEHTSGLGLAQFGTGDGPALEPTSQPHCVKSLRSSYTGLYPQIK